MDREPTGPVRWVLWTLAQPVRLVVWLRERSRRR